MRLIIAGSRWITDRRHLEEAFKGSWADPNTVSEVVCGYARGADTLGKRWAEEHGIPVKVFRAIWRDRDGGMDRSAGHQRNERMAEYADALLALWDGQSGGTADMIARARKHGLEVYIHFVKD